MTTQARILVCEDEPDIAEILRSFLSAQGYGVTTTSTAAEALAQFAEKEPDLVLLDVMLPDKDGWQVLAEIREKRPAGDPPHRPGEGGGQGARPFPRSGRLHPQTVPPG